MTKIIQENDIFRKYDYSGVINPADNSHIIATVRDIIAKGNYFDEQHSPKYQTKENIFARQTPTFLKLRMTFVMSCFFYLGKEVRIKGINAWSFQTNAGDNLERDRLWHHHHQDQTYPKLSGIYYVHIPTDEPNPETSGTEFATSGDLKETFYITPRPYTWLIYPSDIWHRPGISTSMENRYVVAGDMQYQLSLCSHTAELRQDFNVGTVTQA
jgi:hypothetical protein